MNPALSERSWVAAEDQLFSERGAGLGCVWVCEMVRG